MTMVPNQDSMVPNSGGGGGGGNLPSLPTTTPNITDTVIGIDAGNPYQFPITDIGFVPSSSNITFYIRVGGSDSNDGLTPATAFATGQHAATRTSFFNYEGLYWPTLDFGPGTFITNPNNAILLPELRNATFPTGAVFGNALGFIRGDSVSTTTIDDQSGFGCFFAIGSTSAWVINNLNCDSDVGGLNAEEGALLTSAFGGALTFSNTHGSDNPGMVSAVSSGTIIIDQCTVTLADINTGPLCNLTSLAFYGNSSGTMGFTNSTYNLPAAAMTPSSGHAFISTGNVGGTVSFLQNTVNNAASWLGTTVNLGGAGSSPTAISTDDGTFNNIPGTGITNIDNSVQIQSANIGVLGAHYTRWGINPISTFGPPTSTLLAPFQWGAFRTSNAGAYFALNDNGTIEQIIFSPLPGLVAALPAAGIRSRRAFVTDATVTTFASIVAGGGANAVPVYDDGTNWRIG